MNRRRRTSALSDSLRCIKFQRVENRGAPLTTTSPEPPFSESSPARIAPALFHEKRGVNRCVSGLAWRVESGNTHLLPSNPTSTNRCFLLAALLATFHGISRATDFPEVYEPALPMMVEGRERKLASPTELRLRLIAPLVIREDRVPPVRGFSAGSSRTVAKYRRSARGSR